MVNSTSDSNATSFNNRIWSRLLRYGGGVFELLKRMVSQRFPRFVSSGNCREVESCPCRNELDQSNYTLADLPAQCSSVFNPGLVSFSIWVMSAASSAMCRGEPRVLTLGGFRSTSRLTPAARHSYFEKLTSPAFGRILILRTGGSIYMLNVGGFTDRRHHNSQPARAALDETEARLFSKTTPDTNSVLQGK